MLFSGNPAGPTSAQETGPQTQHRDFGFEICEPRNNVVVCGTRAQIAQLRAGAASVPAELIAAFEAAGDTTAQVIVTPSEDHRRALKELASLAPAELPIGSPEEVIAGFRWAALGVTAPPALSLELTIQASDGAAAQRLSQFIRTGLAVLASQHAVRKHVPGAAQIAEMIVPQVEGSRLTVSFNEANQGIDRLRDLVTPPLEQARESSHRVACMNNLKNLALAMHNFHDAYGSFPPSASYDDQGKQLLSWRVFVLPFIGEQKLYEQFRLDEPWDSEHNRALIAKMPAVFACPSADLRKDGKTTYLAPLGEKTAFSGRQGNPIRSFTDGTSNTILLVEGDERAAVIWTKPADLEIDVENPTAFLSATHGGGFAACMCDGSVRIIPKDYDKTNLGRLFMRNDGEVIDD
jgi:hypothetical protein